MALRKSLLVLAFFITLSLMLSILVVSSAFNNKRQESLDQRFEVFYRDFNDMQKFMLMSEVYGDEMACLAFKAKLRDLDTRLWDLGVKLEQYRVASEEFAKDEYYSEQKEVFNENEVLYLMLLKQIQQRCDYDQAIISFFYRGGATCPKCDDQSFVLTDIKRDFKDKIAIFSFDDDLNLTTVSLLREYYGIDEYPCLIIDERRVCGMLDSKEIVAQICLNNTNSTICHV